MTHRVLFVGIGGDYYTSGLITALRDTGVISFAAGVIDEHQDHSPFDCVPAHFSEGLFGDYNNFMDDGAGVSDQLYSEICSAEGGILRQMDRLVYEPLAHHRNHPFLGSFDDRRHLLFRHLRFWNKTLSELSLDAVVFHNVPHQVFDTVLYHMSKSRGIPTLIFSSVGVFRDSYFVSESIDEVGLLDLGARLRAVCTTDFIDIEERIQRDWTRVCNIVDSDGAAHVATNSYSLLRSIMNDGHIGGSQVTTRNVIKAFRRRFSMLRGRGPIDLMSLSRKRSRVRAVSRARREEQENVSVARLPEKFLYFPLHFQPEASTSARGRHYVELREVVASLASSMPNDVMLVIKEHPHQYEKLLPRPPGFFASLMALPKVHLVESSMPSAKLRKLSLGVVTVSGSNGFEVLATGKQVIAFGSAAWREAPGVWNVRSQADIESAVASMCTKLTRDRSEYLPFIARLKSATFLADYSDSRKGRTHQEDELLCRATRTNTLLVVQAWLRGLTSS
jgi:hypothetical protein